MITRDSAVWWFGIVAAVCAALVANLGSFDWMGDTAKHWISFAALVVGTISGAMKTSPLPGKYDQ